jgi:MFS superfamily sulfate permease-like transporter
VVVFRFGADLFYANANRFTEDVLALAAEPGVDWVCIDAAAISDIDYSGGKTLGEIRKTLDERHIRLVLADVSDDVRAQLDRYGLSADLGADGVFDSVGEAIAAHRSVVSTVAPSPTDTGGGGPRPDEEEPS